MKKILFTLALALTCFVTAAHAESKKVAFGTVSAVNVDIDDEFF